MSYWSGFRAASSTKSKASTASASTSPANPQERLNGSDLEFLQRSSIHHPHAILPAELIRLAARTLGIVSPLAIDQQPVFVPARRQRDRFFPRAVLVLF